MGFYRPQTLGQGNVFTPVCQSFCSQGVRGVCPSPWMQTQGWADPLLDADDPWGWADPPPLDADLPGVGQTPHMQTPPHTVNKRAVRILLECILVSVASRKVMNFYNVHIFYG